MAEIKDTSNLLAAMEANYIAYITIGLARLPYMELHSDAELTWLVSDKLPGWNNVLRTRLTIENVAARVEAILDHFKSSNLPLGWQVLPLTHPADLGRYLEAGGMKRLEGRPHMLADLSALPSHLPVASGLVIELVHDAASFERWFQATIAGFEMSQPHAQIYFDAYTLLEFDPAGPFLHYTGYLDGAPVTSSTLLLTEGMTGIFDVSTAPAARGRGLGTAITLAPMLEARARGYRYACLQSSPQGYNVYRSLGFEEQYRESNYGLEARHG